MDRFEELNIPKKPVSEIDKMFGDIYLCCPNCKNVGIISIVNGNGFKYCPECGQALDWR